MPGAVDSILRCLDRFGLHWDGDVYYQSHHLDNYQQAIVNLQEQHQLYACSCSRLQLANYPGVYPGFCRDKSGLDRYPHALRVKVGDAIVAFEDVLQGRIEHCLAIDDGDFVIKRKDGIVAYQLAVVVDDYCQQVNQVVRGFDLLDSTPKQFYLHRLLGYAPPGYAHVPIIVDERGQKLSKQSRAEAVEASNPSATLFLLLQWLRQDPPAALINAQVAEILAWAVEHWQLQVLLRQTLVKNR